MLQVEVLLISYLMTVVISLSPTCGRNHIITPQRATRALHPTYYTRVARGVVGTHVCPRAGAPYGGNGGWKFKRLARFDVDSSNG